MGEVDRRGACDLICGGAYGKCNCALHSESTVETSQLRLTLLFKI